MSNQNIQTALTQTSSSPSASTPAVRDRFDSRCYHGLGDLLRNWRVLGLVAQEYERWLDTPNMKENTPLRSVFSSRDLSMMDSQCEASCVDLSDILEGVARLSFEYKRACQRSGIPMEVSAEQLDYLSYSIMTLCAGVMPALSELREVLTTFSPADEESA